MHLTGSWSVNEILEAGIRDLVRWYWPTEVLENGDRKGHSSATFAWASIMICLHKLGDLIARSQGYVSKDSGTISNGF